MCRNDIPHKLYLISLIYNVSACEPLFKRDRQFDNIEQVESKIMVQVGVDINIFEIQAKMFSDEVAYFICKGALFQNTN
jgi:hypothetical protein